MLQENKARQIFRKTSISQLLIPAVRNIRFSENLACFVFFLTTVLRFALLPYYRLNHHEMKYKPCFGRLLLFSFYSKENLPYLGAIVLTDIHKRVGCIIFNS